MARLASHLGMTSVVVVTLAVLSIVTPAFAQSTSRIAGAVLDPLNAPIAGASVSLVVEGRPVADTRTAADGTFVFEGLAAGRYQVRAGFDGFQPRTTDPFFVARGATTRMDVTLPLGPLETAVSVTAAATGVLPSQVGAAVTVIDADTLEALGKPSVAEALRLVPGSSLVESGGRGGTTSIFIRGGNSNFNRVLLDGVPVNDLGGGVDLATFALAGIDRIEVLRQANSVIAGPDALAGVIAATTTRGTTRIPQVTFGLDGGTFGTHRESGSVGGVVGRADYFSEFANFGTDNDQPNNGYRVRTYAGRFGAAVTPRAYLSGTVRWIDRDYASPGSMALYGTPDDSSQANRMSIVGIGGETQITDKWLASARVGLSDQRADYRNPTTSGTVIFGIGYGDVMTIRGANGYTATGRGVLDYGPFEARDRATRRGVYAQTTYEVTRALSISGGGNFERESAYSDPDADPTTTRDTGTIWLEGRGSIAGRLGLTAGLGYARIEGYAGRATPRLSASYLLRKPDAASTWHDTRVTFNVGRGVKATSATAVARSLYRLLQQVDGGPAMADRSGIGPIGPERGRNLDVGLEQGLLGGRVRGRVSYFNNEFFDLVEFVSRNQLPAFGVPSALAALVGSGAYVNSQSYRAQGVEASVDARAGDLRVSASYTHLDAQVTRSLSSSVIPEFNPDIPGIAIGGYTALVGQRPFRRPANTGSLLVAYARGRVAAAVSGYFAGTSDDSTFLVGSDENFGNTLLLPNRDLNFGYAKVDVSGSVQLLPRLRWFATVENLLDDSYQPAFGIPALPINARTGLTLQLGGR